MGFSISIGSETDAKLNIVVKLFFQEHVKNDISISHNNYQDFQHLFRSQKIKLWGEGWCCQQTRQVFQSDYFREISRSDK